MVAIADIDMPQPLITVGPNVSKITFAQALRDKYVNQEIFDNGMVLPKDDSISTDITFVGFATVTSIQRQLHRLTSVDLSSMGIEAAGAIEEFEGSLSKVTTLNLANNNLPWHQIALINSYLPHLQELILTGSKLTLNSAMQTPSPTKNLRLLTLGRSNLDWYSVIKFLSRLWLHVEQIDLWDNGLDSDRMSLKRLDDFELFINQLRVLRLSHNHFLDFSFLNRVGPIHNLTELDLSSCSLRSIVIDNDLAVLLENLRVLNISYNNLADWRSISNLHMFRKLENLICHENPIFITEKFARSLVVGRLGNLGYLNREEITQRLRRDSEIFYLKRAFPEYQASEHGQTKDFSYDHPRYEELLSIYGVPEDLTSMKVADKYINVELCLADKKFVKKLPCDMRIAKVRMICKQLFKLRPSSRIQIVCITNSPNNDINYILDKDGQTLDFFSVKSGHKLLIEEIN